MNRMDFRSAMFHLADGASTFGVTLCGGQHAFVPRFEPVEVLQTIQFDRVTHAQFVPTMINMLANHPRLAEFDVSTLSLILYGASPMPEGVLRKAMQVMPHVRLLHAYGMTEAAPIVERFLATDFEGGRHERRVEEIAAVERGEEL